MDQCDLGTTQLRCQRKPLAQSAHLVDRNFRAQLVTLVVGLKADALHIRMRLRDDEPHLLGWKQLAAAAGAAGETIAARRAAQQPLRDGLGPQILWEPKGVEEQIVEALDAALSMPCASADEASEATLDALSRRLVREPVWRLWFA